MTDEDLIDKAAGYGTPGLLVALAILGLRWGHQIRTEMTAALGAIRGEINLAASQLRDEIAKLSGRVHDDHERETAAIANVDREVARLQALYDSADRRMDAADKTCDDRHHRLRSDVQALFTKSELAR